MSDGGAVENGEAQEVIAEPVVELLYDMPKTISHAQTVLHPTRENYASLLKKLHDDGYLMIVDLCGVDYLKHFDREIAPGIQAERFEVVVNLINHRERSRLRLRIQVPETDPVMPSAYDLYPGTEAMERETFDMFGIVFEGHPDLTRILMPEDWVGHPLRKDYDVGRIPVQFKAANR